MYVLPAPEDPVLFGDVFVATWLSEAWLEEDAARLGRVKLISGHEGFSAYAASEADDFVLAHGRTPIASLLVNDDCYIEGVLDRERQGRLHFAPVFDLDEDDDERRKQLSTSAYSQFPLPPSGPFAGGIAALNCVFGFEVRDAERVASLRDRRLLQLNQKMVGRLETRWGAHAARRGPLVASTTRRKLEVLLPDGTDSKIAAKLVSALLSTTWAHEGGIADLIDAAAEEGRSCEQILDELLELIDVIARDATDAGDALRGFKVDAASTTVPA